MNCLVFTQPMRYNIKRNAPFKRDRAYFHAILLYFTATYWTQSKHALCTDLQTEAMQCVPFTKQTM